MDQITNTSNGRVNRYAVPLVAKLVPGRNSSSLDLRAQRILVVTTIIVICGLLDIANAFLQHLSGSQADWPVVNVFLFWVTYAAFVPGVLFLINKYKPDLRAWLKKLSIHTAAAIAFAYLHTSLCALLNPSRWRNPKPSSPSLFQVVNMNFPIDFLAYWAIIAIVFALEVYSRWQQRELAAAQLQANLAEVRLRSIRTQLNPHFLFNTLNAISALALRGEGKSVARALSRLTGLLRVNLSDYCPEMIPLRREMELIDNYLEIQRLLLSDRLNVERKIAAEVLRATVPCMILQPLVENAIIHGISASSGPGRIVIEAHQADETLVLRVEDSGSGFPSEQVTRPGVGIANTRARLEHHYGSGHRIEFGRSAEGGACVTILVPLLRETSESHGL